MYKKTTVAGVLFAALYGAAFIASGYLFFIGTTFSGGPGLDGSAFGEILGKLGDLVAVVVIFIAVVFAVIAVLLLIGSIGIIKKGKKSAEDYAKKRAGTIVFIIIQGFVALVAGAIFGGGALGLIKNGDGGTAEIPVYLVAIPVVVIVGLALLIADAVKNTKDLETVRL
jgi:hypothetical protein